MGRNSAIALFLLYRRRKRRRNRLHWVHSEIKKKKKEEFGAFTHYLVNYEMAQTGFLNYFRMSVSSFDEMHRRLKESL
jgi:hypothetical protein